MAQTRGFQIQAQPVYTPADPRLLAFNPALIGQGIDQGLQLADQYATQKENRALAPFRQAAAQTNAELAAIQLAEAQKNMSEIPLGIALKEIPRGDFPVPADLPEGTVGNPNVPAGTPFDLVEVERVKVGDKVIERPRRIVQSAEDRPKLLTLTKEELANLPVGSRYNVVARNPDGSVQVEALQGANLATAPRAQQGGTFRLSDGSTVKAVFDPQRQGYFYTSADGGLVPVPSDAQPTTSSVEGKGMLSVKDFYELENQIGAEENSLRSLQSYYNSAEGARQGIGGLVDSLTASLMTLAGSENLSDTQLSQLVARGQLQGLIGQVRTDVLGPGVLTNQDAQRLLYYLGGDGVLKNKEQVRQAIGSIIAEKYERYNRMVAQYNAQAGKGIYSEYEPISPIDVDTSQFKGRNTDKFVRPDETTRKDGSSASNTATTKTSPSSISESANAFRQRMGLPPK